MQNKFLKLSTIVLSALLLLVSLTQTAYLANYSDQAASDSPAFMAFLLGWMNINGPGISWVANPLLFLSWIFLFSAPKKAFICSASAPLSCLSFLLFDNITVNEGGGHSGITGLRGRLLAMAIRLRC